MVQNFVVGGRRTFWNPNGGYYPRAIEETYYMEMADQSLKMREIVVAIGISQASLVSVLNDH